MILKLIYSGCRACSQSNREFTKISENAVEVLFSTVAVSQGLPFHSSTAVAKTAREDLGKSLAAEWAPKFRVNIIAPSITDTAMEGHLLSTDDKRKKSVGRHPIQQVGDSIVL